MSSELSLEFVFCDLRFEIFKSGYNPFATVMLFVAMNDFVVTRSLLSLATIVITFGPSFRGRSVLISSRICSLGVGILLDL